MRWPFFFGVSRARAAWMRHIGMVAAVQGFLSEGNEMPRKSLSASEAAAWAVLQYCAKLNLQKHEIARGNYPVELRVTGTVAGHRIDFAICGEATQSGPQTTASTTGPGKEELWALARLHIPATRIANIEAEAIALFAEEERLPGVNEDASKAAKPFLKNCRASQSTTKTGAFTFAADPDKDDLQAAILRDAA